MSVKRRLKIAVCFVWVAVACAIWLLSDFRPTEAQTKIERGTAVSLDLLPESDDIERFDAAIQKRFLTEPNFGMARIAPTEPQPFRSGHVRGFHPVDDDEATLMSEFQKDGWRVGLYLFGKRAEPDEKRKDPLEKFKIRYRVNLPMPITHGLREKDLPGSKSLIKEVKQAFSRFQTDDAPAAGDFRFAKDKWTFVARPVRAVNDSCVKCHTDYVVTDKLDDGRFRFRKRKLGDVNGVIIYAFSRSEKD